MTPDDVRRALAALEAMKLEEAPIAWVRRMKSSPPKISAGLFRLALAHALQSKAVGGITRSTDRKLCELAAGVSGPPPGTRLSRSWQGKLHIVIVTEEQKFDRQGKDWDSFSVIARTITGTRWSGPVSFGTRAWTAA